jgi:ribonuclease HI
LNVIFKKVKSHSGNKYNDLADQLAKAGLKPLFAKN